MAIRWDNVSGPSVAQAASSLGDAQKTFSGMFSGIDDILKKREAMETANWDQGKLNNTNAFLNATQEAKTPEEFAAREAMLREQLKGYGAQIDPMAARAALDGRMSTLQQRAKAEWEFQNAQTDQKEAPIRDEALAAIARRDFLTANIIKSGNPGMRNMAAIEQAQATAARNQTVEGNQDTIFANGQSDQRMQEALHPGVIALQTAQINAAKESAATSRASRQAASNEKGMLAGVNSLLVGHNQAYNAENQAWNAKAKEIGAALKMPMNAQTGMPDLTAVNPETLQLFRAKVGAPPSSSERLAVFKKQMSDAGVPLKSQIDAEAVFDKAFGTGASISDVDKKNLDTRTKQLEERLAARKKGSMLYPGSEEERQAELVATQAFYDGRMKDTWFVGDHRTAIDDIMQNGLKVSDTNGAETTYPITPKLMKLALSSKMNGDAGIGSLWFNNTKGNVKEFLTEYVQSPQYAKELSTLAEIEADPSGNAAKRKILESYSRPGMPTGPVQYMNSIDDTLASANARAQEAARAQKKTQ